MFNSVKIGILKIFLTDTGITGVMFYESVGRQVPGYIFEMQHLWQVGGQPDYNLREDQKSGKIANANSQQSPRKCKRVIGDRGL